MDDIVQLFSRKDAILMAAWMLPNTGKLTDTQRLQAIKNFAGYIHLHGVTVTDVARQIGSPKRTIIDEMLKGIFRQNADEHVRKLNMWVEQHARARVAQIADRFVSTSVATAILTRARLVRENGTMGLLVGPTGIGKSRCAQAVHEQTPGSLYVRINHQCRTPKGLIGAIAERLGVRSVADHVADARRHRTQYERIVATLLDSRRLVILDESQKLTDDALEVLRDLHDETGVPILMLATADLHRRIQSSIDPDHGQQYSRIEIITHLTQGRDVNAGDKKALFSVEDIKALYDQVPIRLSTDAVKYLHEVANRLGHGSLRWCKTLLRNAARRARTRAHKSPDQKVDVVAADLDWAERHLKEETSEHEMTRMRRKPKRAAGA